ncbi:MAG: hypothetical protein AAGI17_08680 [Planctomycetota bacterium]
MTDRHDDTMNQLDPEQMSREARIRAVADGEIGPEHVSESDAGAVAFEQSLRSAVGRAMASGEQFTAPAGLRDRIASAVAADSGTPDSEADNTVSDDEFARRLDARAEQTRSASFWSGSTIVSIGTLAAAVVMMLAVFSFNSRNQTTAPSAYTTTLAQFVAAEHMRTTPESDAAESKFIVTTHDDAVAQLAERLGAPTALPTSDTDEGGDVGMSKNAVRFRGLGNCKVPGEGTSSHAQYLIQGPQGATSHVSLFVKQHDDMLDLETGVTYEVDTAACGVDDSRIIVWTDGSVTYVLVAQDAAGKVCDKVLEKLGQPMPTQRL